MNSLYFYVDGGILTTQLQDCSMSEDSHRAIFKSAINN